MPRLEDDDEEFYAKSRVPGRFYVSRRFREGASEAAADAPWCRMAYQVFDENREVAFESENGWTLVVRETPIARQQLKALFFEDSRHIGHLVFQRFSADGKPRRAEHFTLSGTEIRDFISFLALISSSVQFSEGPGGVRLERQVVRELLQEDAVLQSVYEEYGSALRELIAADVRSPEITALARRRHQVVEFGRMLTEPVHFDDCRQVLGDSKGPARAESVWQRYFEQNAWIFGTGLAPQFLHSWSPEKLEQAVVGATTFGPGKRADGLLRTAGAISALVFVEIKTHSTALLYPTAYRSGAWRVSDEVSGGVAQCQAEVDMTVRTLEREVERISPDGWPTGEWTTVCRPRSLLVVGSLDQFVDGDGNRNVQMFESFERFRRSLKDPEIITFDELYARARMVVTMSEVAPGDAR